jgi:hypothetical protein
MNQEESERFARIERRLNIMGEDLHFIAHPRISIGSVVAAIGLFIGIAASISGIWSLVLQIVAK